MPANPRLLLLRIQRLMKHGSLKLAEIGDLVEQADELTRSLPPERMCMDDSWKTLRSSGLLEELVVMATTLPGVMQQPTPVGIRCIFACISALYYAFWVIDFKHNGSAEIKLGERCTLMVSRYVQWFVGPFEDWPGLPQSRRQILLLIYRLCAHERFEHMEPSRIDESMLELIDFKDMVSIIVGHIFDPTQLLEDIYQLEPHGIWAGCQMLRAYRKTKGFSDGGAETFSKRYGARNMTRRCATIIQSIPASSELLVHVSTLVQYLVSAPSFHRLIIEDWHLHGRLMRRWWEVERTRLDQSPDVELHQALFFSDLQALVDALPTKRLQDVVIRDLIQDQDLVLLLGNGTMNLNTRDPEGRSLEPFYRLVVQCCRDDILVRTTCIDPSWLHVMNCLRRIWSCADSVLSTPRDKRFPTVDDWQEFGDRLGITEASLRREHAQAREKESGALVGCFFLKCPLYGEDINIRVDPPLRCIGCKSVQYCSIGCQKLHWYHNHKDFCRSLQPLKRDEGAKISE